MYHPTSRVLAVLEMLQSYKRMTGVEMARRLEVNVRTLRRYVTILQDLGIPIAADRGRTGAYTLGAGYRLPPMMFTNDEALALEIGLLAASQLGLTEESFAIESARAKLETVMPLDLKTRTRALRESIRLAAENDASPPATQIMMVISSATHLKQRVHVQYQARDEAMTARDLDPYGIAYVHGCWYVVGWCHLRNAIRSFRMDRILDARLSEIEFAPPETFDAVAHVEQSIALMPRRFTFEVLLKTDIVTAQRYVSDILGVLETHGNDVLLRGSAEQLSWLATILSGLPFPFVIQQPAELRQALRDHAAELARRAEL